MLGVGGTVGTGIFLTLAEAVPKAGPAVLLSEDGNFNSGFDAGEDLNQTGSVNIRTLPPQFINPLTGEYEIGRVLLQSSRTHDYNWLLTVRRGRDGQARGVERARVLAKMRR